MSRFVNAFVEGVHFYKTRKVDTIRYIAKFMRTNDFEAVREAYQFYERIMPRAPYPSRRGFQAVMNHIAKKNPKVAALNVDDMVDGSFIKELEQSGFIGELYSK